MRAIPPLAAVEQTFVHVVNVRCRIDAGSADGLKSDRAIHEVHIGRRAVVPGVDAIEKYAALGHVAEADVAELLIEILLRERRARGADNGREVDAPAAALERQVGHEQALRSTGAERCHRVVVERRVARLDEVDRR